MMRSSIRSAALLLGLALAPMIAAAVPETAPATAPATQPTLTPQDLALLGRLEAGSWRQRQAAQQELASRGFEGTLVINAMLAQTKSIEAKARLTAVLKQMDDARRLGTSRITLHFKDAPASTVYAALFAQAWAPLKPYPGNLLDSLPPLSVDADHEPFWTVMQRLGKTTQLGLDRPVGAYVVCRGGTVVAGPQVISGGFLVVLSGVRPFIMGNNAGGVGKCFWLDLSVYPEPKMNVQLMNPQVEIDQATDDRGNAIQQDITQTAVLNNTPPGGYSVSLCMKSPAKNPGSRLVHFRGMLRASVALRSAQFDIENLADAKPQSIDVNGLSLKFTGCKKVAGRFYQVSFETPTDPQNRFQQIMESTGLMRLIDGDGHDMQCFGSAMSQNPAIGNTLAYTFGAQAGAGVPKRLVWEIPTVIHTLDIPVDFKDINLDFTRPGNPAAPGQGEDDKDDVGVKL
jgi:hypothetical protein